MMKERKPIFHFVIFALFLCLQACVVFSLPLFGDDYYYATFTDSAERFLSENIKHYQEVNGRALVHLFDELLLSDRTLTLFGIVDLLAIGAAVFFAAAIAAKCWSRGFFSRRFSVALPTACLMFTILDIPMLRGTAYWATGAANYLFPMTLLMIFSYFILAAVERRKMPRAAAILLPLCAFLIGESTEQASAAVCAVALFSVWRGTGIPKEAEGRKRVLCTACLSLALGATGFAILFLAPGNAVRTTYYPDFYAQPLLSRLKENLKIVLNYNIGMWSGAAFNAVTLTVLAVYAAVAAKRRGMERTARTAGFLLPVSFLAVLHFLVLRLTGSDDTVAWGESFALTGFSLLAVLCLYLLVFFARDKTFYPPAFLLLACALQGAMLFSPEIGQRTSLSSSLLLIVPVAEAAGVLFEEGLRKGTAARILTAGCLAAVCAAQLLCGADTARRYLENVPAYRENARCVEEWKAANDPDAPLIFVHPRNEQYHYILPYESPYHAMWYKILNGIPQETEIRYDWMNGD